MTSEAGRKKRKRRKRIPDRAPSVRPSAAPGRWRTARSFTLLELLLAVTLLVLLAGMVIGSFYGTLEATRIEESTTRICSLLRTARAEAALTGRRLRLGFDADARTPLLSIEPDPLAEPNTFRPYPRWWVDQARLAGGVRVIACELTGASAYADLAADLGGSEGGDEPALAVITFTPDGGSDSARIVLASEDQDNPWAVEITLNGADGTIQTRPLDTEEEPIEQR